jgi:hypothetical protein
LLRAYVPKLIANFACRALESHEYTGEKEQHLTSKLLGAEGRGDLEAHSYEWALDVILAQGSIILNIFSSVNVEHCKGNS